MPDSAHDLAIHYGLGHIESARLPGTRLSDLLAKLNAGKPLSQLALQYLQQQKLNDLYRLAVGEITTDAYFSALDQGRIAEQRAAKARLDAQKETYVSARRRRPSSPVSSQPQMSESAQERRQRVREETEAVLRAQQARRKELLAQQERNLAAARVAYEARHAGGATPPTKQEIAAHFHLSDLPEALSAPLSEILAALYQGIPLTAEALSLLQLPRLRTLQDYSLGRIDLAVYQSAARSIEEAALAHIAREKARIARESDPVYQARKKRCEIYRIHCDVDKLPPRLAAIFEQLEAGTRLREEDFAWLYTEEGEPYTSPDLLKACHLLEANFHADHYRKTANPWIALTACKHYRKAKHAALAVELLDLLSPERTRDRKLRSAILTTRGGAMRDLDRREQAIALGTEAHTLQPDNYRPCTLLGALHMELRHFDLGHAWYMKAEQRGAKSQGIDDELRSIYRQADTAGKAAMKAFLLQQDPERYAWLQRLR
ncbi:hypothetical protein [Thauera sp.]|uniref:hypothetical protein n=1 Tax=Thauera sp. TaxID=1905334 RepID=UPI002BDB7B3D|nr:hypothetical protein [Thauera sp.]HRP26436.1 hypothetical protein [Thauera sp.]